MGSPKLSPTSIRLAGVALFFSFYCSYIIPPQTANVFVLALFISNNILKATTWPGGIKIHVLSGSSDV